MKTKLDKTGQIARTLATSQSVLTINDPFNLLKQWEVRKTSCGHFHLLQYVNGILTGLERRTTKTWINHLFNRMNKETLP